MMTAVKDWLRGRLGYDDIVRVVEKKDVPVHRHSFWYYWGGMTLFLFVIQVVTGIMLLLYYRASADEAYESIHFIMTQVQFGWMIRSVHSWSANLMVGAAMIHMFSVFLMKAYRSPREITWLSGMILLGITLGFGFSGYLLPWNQLAYFATKVGSDIMGVVPLIGEGVKRFMLGGDQISGGTLTRFYGFHVALLPLITTFLLGLHLYLVQRHGMSIPTGVEQTGKPMPRMKFFPNFLLRDIIGWLSALGLLALLAALFPWELGEKADPFAPAPEGIRPEWYFGWMFQILKSMPAHIARIEGEVVGVLGIMAAALVWSLAPFFDRSNQMGTTARMWTAFGVIAIVFIVIFTGLSFR